MKRVVLIAGVKSQAKKETKAKLLFTGKLFEKTWALSEYDYADATYILTKEHHVVEPDTVLSPYEENLLKSPVAERREWAEEVLKALEDKGYNLDEDLFIIYAREKYYQYLIGGRGIKHYTLPYEHLEGSDVGPIEANLKRSETDLSQESYPYDRVKEIRISEEKSAQYDISKIKTFGDLKKLLIEDTTLKIHIDRYGFWWWYNYEYGDHFYDEKTKKWVDGTLPEEEILERCDDNTDNYCKALKLTGIAPERISHKGCKYIPTEEEKAKLDKDWGDIFFMEIYIS